MKVTNRVENCAGKVFRLRKTILFKLSVKLHFNKWQRVSKLNFGVYVFGFVSFCFWLCLSACVSTWVRACVRVCVVLACLSVCVHALVRVRVIFWHWTPHEDAIDTVISSLSLIYNAVFKIHFMFMCKSPKRIIHQTIKN